MKALLVVDVQKDFCSGGALAVPEGDSVVPVINALMKQYDVVVASKDWHPENSNHFKKWPRHCVQNTPGAEFHPELNAQKIQQVFLTGTDPDEDGYSAFDATNLDLENYLRERKVDELHVCGLATDYCVRASALDAQQRGFKVFVIEDAVKGVNVVQGDAERAVEEMKQKGVQFIRSEQVGVPAVK